MIFYKYRSLTPTPKAKKGVAANIEYQIAKLTAEFDRERLEQILIDKKIYFSNFNQLNDPFEVKPIFIIPEDLEERRKFAKKLLTDPNLRLTRAQQRKKLPKEIERLLTHRQEYEDRFRNNLHLIRDTSGVLCLSKTFNNIPMWGHYSSNSAGVCIGFDCVDFGDDEFFELDKDFKGFFRVNYVEEKPQIKLGFLGAGNGNNFNSIISCKHKSWAYEEEYRFFKNEGEGGPGLYPFPINKIKEIILGPKMEEREKDYVCTIVKDNLPKTQCYSSKLSDEEYRVEKDVQLV